MPTQSEHLYKATNNKIVADEMSRKTPTSIGWAITILFYSALHYVEAYNAKFNYHFHGHTQLINDMGRNPVFSTVFDNYQELSSLSWNARYRPRRYGDTELKEAIESHAAICALVCTKLGIRNPDQAKTSRAIVVPPSSSQNSN
jgi:hypothetical protein